MKQGVIKFSIFVIAFFATTFLINSQNEPAMAFELPTSVTLNCVDNAVAPLNNLIEIQTFLSCNGLTLVQLMVLVVLELMEQLKAFKKL